MKKLLIFFLLLTFSKLVISKDYLTCEGSWAWVINNKHMGDYDDKVVIIRDKSEEYDHIDIGIDRYRNEKYKEKDLKDGRNLEPYFIETDTEIIVSKYGWGGNMKDKNYKRTKYLKLNRISGELLIKEETFTNKGTMVNTFTGFCKKADKML